MNRVKTFDATGVAPNGKLYSGDLNAIQDAAAALTDLTQVLSVGSLTIGESGLTLSRYGAAEAQLAGKLRVSGILRALAGVAPPSLTTTQRDALPSGSRDKGLIIYNTTNGRLEHNAGTDAAPNWQPVGATGPFGTADIQDGAITNVKLAGSIDPTKVTGTAVITSDSRLSNTRTPTDGTVTSAKYGPLSISSQVNSYTLVLADAWKVVEVSNAAAVTVTVPPSASVAYPIGTVITVVQTGAGQVTIAAGSGVTLRANPGLKLSGQYAMASLYKRAADEWVVSGNLVT